MDCPEFLVYFPLLEKLVFEYIFDVYCVKKLRFRLKHICDTGYHADNILLCLLIEKEPGL